MGVSVFPYVPIAIKGKQKHLSTWETVNVRIKNEVYLFYSTLVECPVLADDATF